MKTTINHKAPRLKNMPSNIIVNAPTVDEAKELLQIWHENGSKWDSGESLLREDIYWAHFKSKTCYRLQKKLRVTYQSKEYYLDEGFSVITLAEFKEKYVDLNDTCTDDCSSDVQAEKKSKMDDEVLDEDALNLCELLKGHEGEIFYSPYYGKLRLTKGNTRIYPESVAFNPIDHPDSIFVYFKSNGQAYRAEKSAMPSIFPSRDLYGQYPLDAKKAWEIWRQGLPKPYIELHVGYDNTKSQMFETTKVIFSTDADRDKCIEDIKAIIEKYSKK